MATTTIKTIFAADGSQLGSTISKVTKDVDSMRKGALSKLASTLGAAFAFQKIKQFSTEAVKSFAEFDQAMRNVNTLAKQTELQLSDTTSQINSISMELGKSPTELAEALYDIVSAGFKGADSLKVLEQATTNAIGGMTSTKVAAKALTATLNAYSLGIEEAEDISNIFQQTVKNGVITYEELATGIGKVLPTAAAANVGFDELGGSIAMLTKQGMDADMAMIALNGLMLKMLKPTTTMTDAWLKAEGVLPSVTLQTKGFTESMVILNTIAGENAPLMAELVNEKRALRGAYATTGEKAKAFIAIMKESTDKLARNKEAANAAAEANKGLARTMETATNYMTVAKNAVGEFLGTTYVNAVEGWADIWGSMFDNYELTKETLDEIAEREEQRRVKTERLAESDARWAEEAKVRAEKMAEFQREFLGLKDEQYYKEIDIVDEFGKQIPIYERVKTLEDAISLTRDKIAALREKELGNKHDSLELTNEENRLEIMLKDQAHLRGVEEKITLGFLEDQTGELENQKNLRTQLTSDIERLAQLRYEELSDSSKLEYKLLERELLVEEIAALTLKIKNGEDGIIENTASVVRKKGDLILLEREIETLTNAVAGNIEKSTENAEKLEPVTEEIKNNLAGAKLPFLSKTQSARWITFLNAINGVNANVGIDVSFMRMASANTLKNWAAFFNAVRGVNALVEVKGFSDADLVRYEALIKKISAMVMPKFDLPDFDDENMKIRVNWTLPDEYEKGIPIDVSALQEIGIDDIAKSLKTLAELKGVIWI